MTLVALVVRPHTTTRVDRNRGSECLGKIRPITRKRLQAKGWTDSTLPAFSQGAKGREFPTRSPQLQTGEPLTLNASTPELPAPGLGFRGIRGLGFTISVCLQQWEDPFNFLPQRVGGIKLDPKP